MDPLTQLLVQRQMAQQPAIPPVNPTSPTGPVPPVVPPSGSTGRVPPQAQRFATAQKMIDAYRNNWTPNPILTQVASK